MTPDRAFEDAYPQLQSVIGKVLAYFHDFSVLFSMVSARHFKMLARDLFALGGPEIRGLCRAKVSQCPPQMFRSPGAFPAVSRHVPEGQCEGGGVPIYHGDLHQVRTTSETRV